MTDTVEGSRARATAPRVEGVVTLRDGRRIGFAEYGPPQGRPVLWFHGTPGARRQVPPTARVAADERNIRIVALERPGVGASTPHAYDSILDWADDVEECVDQLGIDRFGIVGLSGGGPYVLAVTYRLADRTIAAAVIGGVAPTRGDDAPEGGVVQLTVRFSVLLEWLQEPLSRGLWALVWGLRPLASQAFDLFAHFSPAGDKDVFAAPGMKEMFTDDLLKATRRQFRAPLADLRLFGRHWGFSPRDLAVPIFLWHGDEDYIVPVAHSEHLADLVPGSELRVRVGAAHLANLTLGHEVLDAMLTHWPDDWPDGDPEPET
jgi:pimeloyl-ACP methyl ester carboxylesterase